MYMYRYIIYIIKCCVSLPTTVITMLVLLVVCYDMAAYVYALHVYVV